MSIGDWFKAREGRRYTQVTEASAKAGVPDGVWTKCESCKHIIYEGELESTMRVCRHCGHHFSLTGPQRIASLADPGTFDEFDAGMTSTDPLQFVAVKSYATSLADAKKKSGLSEAVVCGRAEVAGTGVVLGAMDFRFVGASMGSAVGEKVARAFEVALAESRPLVLVTASGGARMQEGMLSLMQMAKTSAAAERLARAGVPYISVLTNPTYGGVTASFATLADIVLAEPGAMIGFAGQRVIEQTIRQRPPKGFQTAEFMMDHGMVDAVVPRSELRERIVLLLGYLTPRHAIASGGGETS